MIFGGPKGGLGTTKSPGKYSQMSKNFREGIVRRLILIKGQNQKRYMVSKKCIMTKRMNLPVDEGPLGVHEIKLVVQSKAFTSYTTRRIKKFKNLDDECLKDKLGIFLKTNAFSESKS